MPVDFFVTLLLFIFGISVGSFLNVLIDRLPRGEQIFSGRSYCEHCKHKLAWYDLLPIVSWISLGGRCRYCHSPISRYYPTVEFLTGILFVFVTIHLRGVSPPLAGPLHLGGVWEWLTLVYYLFIISALIVIFFTDLKYQIIPDQIVYPAILISLLFLILQLPPPSRSPYGTSSVPAAFDGGGHLEGVLTALAAGLFFLFIVLITGGRGMGMGDVKLAALMGIILGFPGTLVAIYLAFLTGAFFGVILILLGKKRFGQHIPFGPFLVASTIISLWWGGSLWQFFQKILGI